MRRTLLTTLALAALGCSAPTDPDHPEAQLEQNRALWIRSGVTSYQITISRVCECLPEMAGPVVVEVRDKVILQRRYQTGAPVDPTYASLFMDVPGLFDLISDAITATAAAVSVRYNDNLGYPESIAIDWAAGAVDDEVSYRITGFTVLR
jgi:hypothetical protein